MCVIVGGRETENAMRAAFKLLLGLTVLALLPTVSMSAPTPVRPDDMTLGNPKAKVVVVEYASLSCPHCARFHNDVFPAFRKKYVDSGKVLFVYREFITGPAEIAVPATVLARCSGKANYFKVIARVFAVQKEFYDDGTVDGVVRILRREALTFGIDEAKFNACMSDQAAFDALQARITRAVDEDKIEGTPTFVVNGKTIAPSIGHEMDLATLDKAIAAAK